ncbi:EamA family transporter [Telmatobacter sp. DSM 110680]|uniref:EamA family transporter n=1 Tax=Telmatobacter sp. DSM 110680 TaxID=3036704 RepID=A0AAU7DIM4_9BACT
MVSIPLLDSAERSQKIRTILAFFAIYILWGTTFLAIRVAVEELPPLFAAGARFFTAGIVLYAFMRFKGETAPTAKQWRSLGIMALLMFVAEYGPLFWAEKYVPSGVVSVLAATLPIITLILEMLILRQQRMRPMLATATILGFVGVAVLLIPGGKQHLALVPCLAILAGATTWSLGSVLTRSMNLPASRPLTAGAAMMLGGAMLLALSAGFGEMHPFPHITLRAAGALLYLIVFGSLLAFTAFVWLLARMPATRVASHAYVNPIVAVALGYFMAGEVITARILAGTALVLISVFLILRRS